jgi:ABC-type Mn2+/Zn2+ transport system permease subunit
MFAFGVIALNSIDSTVSVSHFLFGQLLTVTTTDVYITAVLTALALAFVWWRFPDLTFSTFDRDHATQIGIRVQRLDASMLVLLAVCVVVSLNTVGIALTVSLLITPTATARLFFNNVGSITRAAVVIGLLEVLGGFVIAYHLDLPPGPTITLSATSVFVVLYAIRFARSERTYVHHTHEHHSH